MKKVKDYFQIKGRYQFEINDLIALIYIVCVIGIICKLEMTPLFLIGCVISFVACIRARKINILLINLAFVVLNGYYFIILLIG